MQVICADAVEGLKQIESSSVHTCITSPPYYGLRDYGVDGQIGLEQSPEEYIARLVAVFREVRRILRDDGTLWVNIGDSYCSTAPGTMGDPHFVKECSEERRQAYKKFRPPTPSGMKPKDLIGIPWMLAFALRADGWYLHQDIIWAKPNPMPESVTDRCTKSHEYIFLLSKSPHYYFDAEAIAEPITESTAKRMAQDVDSQQGSLRVPGKTNGPMKAVPPRYGGNKYTATPDVFSRTKSGNAYNYQPMRNKRDVWNVATKGFKEAHFAVFPEELIIPCVLAGCPEGGTVCDPFTGSGTTGIVALENGRSFIGCELNPAYADMARRRISKAVQQLKII